MKNTKFNRLISIKISGILNSYFTYGKKKQKCILHQNICLMEKEAHDRPAIIISRKEQEQRD